MRDLSELEFPDGPNTEGTHGTPAALLMLRAWRSERTFGRHSRRTTEIIMSSTPASTNRGAKQRKGHGEMPPNMRMAYTLMKTADSFAPQV